MFKQVVIGLLILLSFDSYSAKERRELVVVKDLQLEWKVYDAFQGHFDFFSESMDVSKISFELALSEFPDQWIYLDLPKDHFVWIDSTLVLSTNAHSKLYLDIDSLANVLNSDQMVLSIFSKTFDHNSISTQIVRQSNFLTLDVANNIPLVKSINGNRNGLIIISVLILLMVVVYRSFNRRVFDEFLAIKRAFMVRQNFDHVGSKHSVSAINVAYVFFYALIVTASVLNGFLANEGQYNWPLIFKTLTVYELGCYVFLFSLLLMFLKLPVIWFLSSLFGLGKTGNLHFYIYLRQSLIFVLVLFSASIVNGILEGQLFQYWGGLLQLVLVIGVVIRLIVLFMVLNKIFTFRKLHLFAYLCGTDAIPLLLFLNYFLK